MTTRKHDWDLTGSIAFLVLFVCAVAFIEAKHQPRKTTCECIEVSGCDCVEGFCRCGDGKTCDACHEHAKRKGEVK